MESQTLVEIGSTLMTILVNLGLFARFRKKIIEKFQEEILAGIQPVLDQHKELMELQKRNFTTICDAVQIGGQDVEEKIRLMTLAIDGIALTQEEIIQRIRSLELDHH